MWKKQIKGSKERVQGIVLSVKKKELINKLEFVGLQLMVDIIQCSNGCNATAISDRISLLRRKAVFLMNIADRIQSLRKSKEISQEELADKIGVSRQAVSKWESEQSLPDIEKIILLSDYFGVTTDYLLKGIEPMPDIPKKKVDARIFFTVGSVFNFIGLIVAIIIWKEKQTSVSVAVGLILMAFGCMIFAIGEYIGENRKISSIYFWMINIWFLSLIPISCMFNCIQGIAEGHWWTFTPIPQLGNSLVIYGLCWLIYFVLCILTDVAIVKNRNRQIPVCRAEKIAKLSKIN